MFREIIENVLIKDFHMDEFEVELIAVAIESAIMKKYAFASFEDLNMGSKNSLYETLLRKLIDDFIERSIAEHKNRFIEREKVKNLLTLS